MARPALEIADIFRDHGAAWRKANAGHVSLGQLKVMSAIESCRTVALGGHVMRCEDCSHTQIAHNSCRNRHCPKCQFFFFKQKTAYEIGLGIPAEPLFRSLEAFYDNPNALRDYFRDIGRMVLAAEGRKANDSHADCYQYFCVPEYGTANGRLHFHAVHFMRTLPTGSVDPNFGRRVRNRR